ncbi:MAG: hypothetical protein EOO61_19160 [Hymenobacter sp.]|nr:MAG: hypothetical protein EOO61_19160 [Hymenobacter sp.]
MVSSSVEFLPQIKTGGVVVHTPPIDYDKLAAAVAAQPADHEGLARAIAQQLTPAFVAGAQALPPQHVNITDLRERIKKEEYWDSQTSIS